MMQVHDLKLKEDVLPFFDYTNDEQAATRLAALLTTVPASEEEVLERQAVVQGMLGNWPVLAHFSYRRLDLREAFTSFESGAIGFAANESKGHALLKLLLSEAERNRLRSRLVQVILLLHDLHQKFLGRLDSSTYAGSFKAQLHRALRFLISLRLEYYAGLIKEHRFTTSRIVEFDRLLQQAGQAEALVFWDFFFTFEAYWSIAKGTLTHRFSFPSFSEDTLKVEDFYHPIVRNPVRNTLELQKEQNVLLLTGPNMAGKSTLLKAVSICVYLARVGFTVPASACRVPFFDSMAIAINLNDNLRDGYSHFMTEIANLKAVISAAENSIRCFAVFDEIFRGTNVDDALDITRTTVSGLTRFKGSFFLISTHLLQLEQQLNGNSRQVRTCYIECVLDQGLPRFSYTLKEGWSQLRIGRILFEKEGLDRMLRV